MVRSVSSEGSAHSGDGRGGGGPLFRMRLTDLVAAAGVPIPASPALPSTAAPGVPAMPTLSDEALDAILAAAPVATRLLRDLSRQSDHDHSGSSEGGDIGDPTTVSQAGVPPPSVSDAASVAAPSVAPSMAWSFQSHRSGSSAGGGGGGGGSGSLRARGGGPPLRGPALTLPTPQLRGPVGARSAESSAAPIVRACSHFTVAMATGDDFQLTAALDSGPPYTAPVWVLNWFTPAVRPSGMERLRMALTADARSVLSAENAGGASENSEALSVELLRVYQGVRLWAGEMGVAYECHSPIIDYIGAYQLKGRGPLGGGAGARSEPPTAAPTPAPATPTGSGKLAIRASPGSDGRVRHDRGVSLPFRARGVVTPAGSTATGSVAPDAPSPYIPAGVRRTAHGSAAARSPSASASEARLRSSGSGVSTGAFPVRSPLSHLSPAPATALSGVSLASRSLQSLPFEPEECSERDDDSGDDGDAAPPARGRGRAHTDISDAVYVEAHDLSHALVPAPPSGLVRSSAEDPAPPVAAVPSGAALAAAAPTLGHRVTDGNPLMAMTVGLDTRRVTEEDLEYMPPPQFFAREHARRKLPPLGPRDVLVGVSVTRAMKFDGGSAAFNEVDAAYILCKKLAGLGEAVLWVDDTQRWSRSVLHIWAEDVHVANILYATLHDATRVEPALWRRVIVVCTIAPPATMHGVIFRNDDFAAAARAAMSVGDEHARQVRALATADRDRWAYLDGHLRGGGSGGGGGSAFELWGGTGV
jgi:hypothetical protein